MRYDWIDEYALAKPGVEKDYKAEWQMFRYMIWGKMFMSIGGDKAGKPILTIKLEPVFGQFLRDQYGCIVPGYYSNKLHWSSMYLDGDVPDNVVRDMIDQAYGLILNALPKATRAAIAGQE